ncbi:MAG: cytochrome-c peroxidase, partial [Pirellula sp.]
MATKKLLFRASLAVGALCSFGPASHAIDSVQLGKDALTVGIPGSDKLTVAEIKKFLDNPSNHVELKVSLPEGLAAGADAIYIPEDNPLTRAKIELGRQLYFD